MGQLGAWVWLILHLCFAINMQLKWKFQVVGDDHLRRSRCVFSKDAYGQRYSLKNLIRAVYFLWLFNGVLILWPWWSKCYKLSEIFPFFNPQWNFLLLLRQFLLLFLSTLSTPSIPHSVQEPGVQSLQVPDGGQQVDACARANGRVHAVLQHSQAAAVAVHPGGHEPVSRFEIALLIFSMPLPLFPLHQKGAAS